MAYFKQLETSAKAMAEHNANQRANAKARLAALAAKRRAVKAAK